MLLNEASSKNSWPIYDNLIKKVRGNYQRGEMIANNGLWEGKHWHCVTLQPSTLGGTSALFQRAEAFFWGLGFLLGFFLLLLFICLGYFLPFFPLDLSKEWFCYLIKSVTFGSKPGTKRGRLGAFSSAPSAWRSQPAASPTQRRWHTRSGPLSHLAQSLHAAELPFTPYQCSLRKPSVEVN